MKPPRVLVIVENLPLARDHRVRKQAEALLGAGFDVSVICRRSEGNDCVDGARVYDYRPPPEGRTPIGFVVEYAWSWLAAAWLMLRVLATTGFDALQVCGAPDIYFPLSRLARALGKPVVYDQRDPSPETYDARYGDGGRAAVRRVLLAFERATHRAADQVIVVNETLRATAVSRGRRAEHDVTVVGNGPAHGAVTGHAPRPELRRGRPHLCCWAGVLGPQDRVELAVRAAAQVIEERGRGDCTFVFIGDGDARPSCERLAARLGIGDVVVFTGWLEQSEVFDYLATADVGLEPNLEPFVSPVKVMEYLAFGLPTVAFDLPETRQVARAAAAYAPPGDVAALARALGDLLDDPARRQRMAAAARRQFRRELAWDRQQPRYLEVYRRLLLSDSRRPAHREVAA